MICGRPTRTRASGGCHIISLWRCFVTYWQPDVTASDLRDLAHPQTRCSKQTAIFVSDVVLADYDVTHMVRGLLCSCTIILFDEDALKGLPLAQWTRQGQSGVFFPWGSLFASRNSCFMYCQRVGHRKAAQIVLPVKIATACRYLHFLLARKRGKMSIKVRSAAADWSTPKVRHFVYEQLFYRLCMWYTIYLCTGRTAYIGLKAKLHIMAIIFFRAEYMIVFIIHKRQQLKASSTDSSGPVEQRRRDQYVNHLSVCSEIQMRTTMPCVGG